MRVSAQVDIKAPKESVWNAVTDIEHAADRIRAIEKVEVLARPQDGLVGWKWRETRTMFGKTATEVMWITAATAPDAYETRAESHGSIYRSRIALEEHGGGTRLTMEFAGEPVSLGARIMWRLTGFMFKGSMRKALQQDLRDIKESVERQG